MRLNRRRFLTIAGAGAAGGIGFYTWRIEPHSLELVRRPLPVRALPSRNRRLYISRGVGHLLQVRFNVRPEVTVFELPPA